ncbi:cell division protein FtsI/penicillin-binding protein 2 [Georgenia soli]|uniref:Cell division protein FtsI/penicillin-binding protein 2 n=1 Tax=Georgenia soli TaxID=638953 RepID=A0A2A9EQW5_9MICO|nr:cell division protein FtsI/penicillin-binding protein 2 [Georgenia soli]
MLLTLSAGLAACSGTDDPGDEAAALARALETGETSSARGLGEPENLEALLGDLAGLPRTVEVAGLGERREVTESRASAVDVELSWAWDLDADGEPDWSYTTTAQLAEDADGAWAASLSPDMIAPELPPQGSLVLERVRGERGDVLAGDGSAIVTDRPVLRVGLDKTRLEGAPEADLRASAEAVASLAGYDDTAAFADRAVAAGPRAFVEAIVVREGSSDVDLDALAEVTGGVALPGELPLAPTATFARALLGRVGEATQEIVEASEGRVVAGDTVGLSGLQEQYDVTLAGRPGLRVSSQVGAELTTLYERPAADGADLHLTLDTQLQTTAEIALAGTTSPAGLVVLRPSTGEILAAASGPGSEGQNTAMLATLAPGSTYKIVTALALLRAGVGPDDLVSCTPDATVEGYTVGNYPGYPAAHLGEITMSDAIAQSCNSALINARDALTPQAMADAAAALGLGRDLAGPWPGFLGSVPADATGTAFAASLIGQGDVLASPLAMATVAASVKAGAAVSPTLVLGPGDVADDPAAVAAPASPLTVEEAEVLRGYMRGVVTGGTATLLGDVPGEPVHAKSGSAEAGGDDARVDSWMTAYRGDLAVAVMVQGGGHGSGVAGGIVRDFLTAVP